MKKFLMFTVCALIFGAASYAQLAYPIMGRYNKLSAQGMAIWEDTAYLFNDTGLCRVYDLKTKTVTGEFMIASAGEKTHVNSANFGAEIPEGGDKPAIYIAEGKDAGRCFVENLMRDRSELVQSIQVTKEGKNRRMLSWAVDAKNGYIYGLSRYKEKIDGKETWYNTITKFRLPKLSEGKEIVFTEADILDSFTLQFNNILQGMKVRGKYIYIVTGLQESKRDRIDGQRAIKVIDPEKKVVKKDVILTDVLVNEPEDMDFYKNKALLFCGQEGGIYEIKL